MAVSPGVAVLGSPLQVRVLRVTWGRVSRSTVRCLGLRGLRVLRILLARRLLRITSLRRLLWIPGWRPLRVARRGRLLRVALLLRRRVRGLLLGAWGGLLRVALLRVALLLRRRVRGLLLGAWGGGCWYPGGGGYGGRC